MSTIRILHVDDEPDIREVAGISLGLNSTFEVRACASGPEAIVTAAEWLPNLIMLDVMMPGMDGPTTLKELRKNPATAAIPVVFVTARAQSREVEHFISLGAQGVISKPFNPMKLATQVADFLQAGRLDPLRNSFKQRVKSDAARLTQLQLSLSGLDCTGDLTRIKEIAHGLAGAAGMYGYDKISRDASTLEVAAYATLDDIGNKKEVFQAIEGLLFDLNNVSEAAPAYVA
ncbi:MAG: response regulator [Xanthobacteraceae bacterium]